jgi:hypothetical protein
MERDVGRRLNRFSEQIEDLWIAAVDLLDHLPPEYRGFWTDSVAFPLVKVGHNAGMLREALYEPDFDTENPLSE